MATFKFELKEETRHAESRTGCTTERAFDLYLEHAGASASTLEARNAAAALINSQYPVDIYGNKPSEFDVEEVADSLGQKWLVRVSYAPFDNESSSSAEQTLRQVALYWSESFSSKGGSSKCTQAFGERRYPCSGFSQNDLPNFQGGIGWNGESFDGCEKLTPNYTFTIKTRLPYESVTPEFQTRFDDMTGTVNRSFFKGFSAGVVLFEGVDGSTVTEYEGVTEEEFTVTPNGEEQSGTVEVPNVYWDATFNFRCQPNRELNISGAQVYKEGWEYLWVLNRQIEDRESGYVIKIPVGVYVNQVYEKTDFGRLGLGEW